LQSSLPILLIHSNGAIPGSAAASSSPRTLCRLRISLNQNWNKSNETAVASIKLTLINKHWMTYELSEKKYLVLLFGFQRRSAATNHPLELQKPKLAR
jgi:hypothetical protein